MKFFFYTVLAHLNFVFPSLLGKGYFDYKNKRLKKYRKAFNPENELLSIVNNSIKSIPFYKNKYGKTYIKSIKEFKQVIDFINKDVVMDNFDAFIAQGKIKSKIVTGTTGGTSGKPLKLILPKNRYIFELATMHTMWQNVDWSGEIRGVLRNHKLNNNEIFRVNPIKKEFIFDGFNTSETYFESIYKILKKYKIGYLHAYPSSAYQFSRFLYRQNKDTSFIKAFLCGSEGILPEQTQLMSNKMGIPIYHWYGHSEKLVLGGYCAKSTLIHVEPTYGYFELVDEQGNLITQIGEIGEIVGTSLHNPYMPLIRYKTGDYAEYAGNYCKHCNRHLPLLKKIYGRWDKNKIYKSDDSYITTTALNLHSNLYDKISGIQYVQKKKGELIVKIIKGSDFNEDIYRKLTAHFDNAFGKGNKVEINFVKTLEKLPNGKFINLISDIN